MRGGAALFKARRICGSGHIRLQESRKTENHACTKKVLLNGFKQKETPRRLWRDIKRIWNTWNAPLAWDKEPPQGAGNYTPSFH
ncbi:MAG: hypothetical protein LBV27_02580 [Oscillospiraceae bacterium]|jgi:hypothetical protein|nr:hypothetical protein [Oscillospiraceae bacterium]